MRHMRSELDAVGYRRRWLSSIDRATRFIALRRTRHGTQRKSDRNEVRLKRQGAHGEYMVAQAAFYSPGGTCRVGEVFGNGREKRA